MRSVTELPPQSAIATFQPGFGQRFLVTVDASEEPDRDLQLGTGPERAAHFARLAEFQRFCETEQITPLYLLDWPLGMAPETTELLRKPVAAGKAEIGLQLHPYTRRSFDDSIRKSEHPAHPAEYPASVITRNLSELETSRFERLRDALEQGFGTTPLVVRAGPQGFGQDTARFLTYQGIAIDSSVRAKFDFSPRGGPNYRRHPLTPYWLDDGRTLLELPLQSVFWGLLRRQGKYLYPRSLQIRDFLARMGLLDRVPLSPDVSAFDQIVRGIDVAFDNRLPLLIFSFQSMSLPANPTGAPLQEDVPPFYDWWRRVLAYLNLLGVHNTNIAEIMQAVER